MKFHHRPITLASSLGLCLLVATGCATRSNSADIYRAGETQVEQVVRLGTVKSVRSVTVQRDAKGGGLVAGAVVGGIAGSTVGEGKGSAIGSVLGALGGAVVGQAIEERASQKAGYELTIQLDSGETRVIVQEADVVLKAGDRVRLIGSGSAVRVTPISP